jgi:hypothetical protein
MNHAAVQQVTNTADSNGNPRTDGGMLRLPVGRRAAAANAKSAAGWIDRGSRLGQCAAPTSSPTGFQSRVVIIAGMTSAMRCNPGRLRASSAGALAVLAVAVAACSSGPSVVSKDDVAGQITTKMSDASGNKPDSVSCPGDLKAQVGAQVNCGMKVKGQTSNVNVTVTSVDGDQAKFDMVETIDKDQVASQLSDQLAQQVGHKPDSVSCPDNLKGTQGATLRCELTDQGQTYGVTTTVTNVQGGDVLFDFKVDDQPK